MAADLDLVRRLVRADHGLAVVATTRNDGTVHASLVNAGVLEDPITNRPVLGFVTAGSADRLPRLGATLSPRVWRNSSKQTSMQRSRCGTPLTSTRSARHVDLGCRQPDISSIDQRSGDSYVLPMGLIEVSQKMFIDRAADVVRQQFADVAHHQATGVHRDASFVVIDDDGQRCRYRQVSRVGPLRLRQDFELLRTDAGPLVNTITRGPFKGGTITFLVEATDDGRSTVEARLVSRVRGLEALVLPVLRPRVRRALARALAEDKADLESGAYPGTASD